MSAGFVRALREYDWPGNVRELENAIEYLVICSENVFLSDMDLYNYLGIQKKASIGSTDQQDNSLEEALKSYERDLIANAIKTTGGIRKAAAFLKVNPSTISRKAKLYGIQI